jgi:hypothetical protein
MPRTRLTCKGRDRLCGARLQIETAAGAGPVDVACPECGDTFAARYVVAQTALRNPGRAWHVRSIHAARHGLLGELEDLQPAP